MPSMRYLWPSLLVLAACAALALWAGRELALRAERDETGLRTIYADLVAEAAEDHLRRAAQAIAEAVQTIAAMDNPGERRRQFTRCRALPGVIAAGLSPAITLPATVGPPPLLAAMTDSRLLDARRFEFSEHNWAEAERLYRVLASADLAESIRQEGWAGIAGVHAKRGDAGGTVTAIAEWLERDPPPCLDQAAAILLAALDEVPDPAAAPVLATIAHDARRVGQHCEAALLARIDTALEQRKESLAPAIRTQHHQRMAFQQAEATALKAWKDVTIPLNDLPSGSASWNALANDRAIVHAGRPDAQRVFAVVDTVALAAQAGFSVRDSVRALPELERTYAERYAKPITDAVAMNVAVPWGGHHAVPLTPPPPGSSPGVNPVLLGWMVLASAVLTVGAGLGAIGFAARRDMRLARLKSDFVSSVTHELKTPLSLVRLYGEMLHLGYAADDTERRHAQQVIVDEAQRLTLLIDNVLDFARIERGEQAYAHEPVDLAALTRKTLATYEAQLTAAGFTVETDVHDGLPEVIGDADALTQVLLNLIANAMKFSPTVKHLRVTLTGRDGTYVAWSVSDAGIGIDSAQHQRIFQPFYRVESGLTRTTRGTGIGLALVRHIVAAHGGTVAVTSALGTGSTFTVILPYPESE